MNSNLWKDNVIEKVFLAGIEKFAASSSIWALFVAKKEISETIDVARYPLMQKKVDQYS
jgi:hypothetical protein